MNKELEAWQEIKLGYICGQGAINEFALKENEREKLNIIEAALNDNHYYKYIISRTCDCMGLDINPFENFIETENAMLNYICENELFRADVAFYKERLKALEIFKKVDVSSLHHFINTYIKDENDRKLLKEMLL